MTVPEYITKDDLFPSRFLKAHDVDKNNPVYTILDANIEALGEESSSKCVLSFQETTKELALNKTNFENLETIYGASPNEWIGKRIELFTTYVDFKGKSLEAVRIKPEKPTGIPAPPPTPEQAPF
jgi:hypothetical protein